MKLYKREIYLSRIRGFYHNLELIKVISGVRRCGKSSLMKMVIDELKESNVKDENIIYINLDKKGYRNIKSNDELERIIDEKSKAKGVKYLFIDEIQNVTDFEILINAYREENEYSIFISGSNSYLLSGELVTKLTGRYIEFEIFPLSFYEFLEMKKFYKLNINSILFYELDDYIHYGGFPGSILIESFSDKQKYINDLTKEILNKDVFNRVKVKNRLIFELIMNYIINNYGMITSLTNIKNKIENSGIKITVNTISKYIGALIDSKIIYPCECFDMKSKRYLLGERKYYLSDLSFLMLTNPDSRINYGPALENIIYTYVRSKNYSVSYGRIGKLECDFILKDIYLNYSYIQVSYSVLGSKETEDREYIPLEKIKDNYPKYVITTDYLTQKRNGIIHLNIFNHLSQNKDF